MAHKIFSMTFASIHDAYTAKVARKNQRVAHVDEVITWFTGYDEAEILAARTDGRTLGEFLDAAPALNANRDLITGSICGVRIQDIDEPDMKLVCQLDKLVDEIAKGRPMDKVLRKG